jgi:hypothetical protein
MARSRGALNRTPKLHVRQTGHRMREQNLKRVMQLEKLVKCEDFALMNVTDSCLDACLGAHVLAHT